MNTAKALTLLPIINALSERKIIQHKGIDGEWHDICHPEFSDLPENYRIKSESRIRPFNREEAKKLVGQVLMDKRLDEAWLILGIRTTPRGLTAITTNDLFNLNVLSQQPDRFTINGKPCYVVEE